MYIIPLKFFVRSKSYTFLETLGKSKKVDLVSIFFQTVSEFQDQNIMMSQCFKSLTYCEGKS